jgi:hypothetical protein
LVAFYGKFNYFFADYDANAGGQLLSSGVVPAPELEKLATEAITIGVGKLEIPTV